MIHLSRSRALGALLLAATIAPALRAQSAIEARASVVAPAGIAAAHRPDVVLQGTTPPAWRRSLARADSLDGRKRAFHLGAIGGGVLTGGLALALVQSGRDDGGDTDDGGPGVGFVVASAAVGALLGGVAGVIVHDVHDAVRRR